MILQTGDLDNIELNVVDLPPGPYNLTIIVVDVLKLTATETIGLFLSGRINFMLKYCSQ